MAVGGRHPPCARIQRTLELVQVDARRVAPVALQRVDAVRLVGAIDADVFKSGHLRNTFRGAETEFRYTHTLCRGPPGEASVTTLCY
jgi:hypothetical protein